MKRRSRWALILVIAGLLGAGIAQVGVTMSEQYAAAEKLAAAPATAGPSCGGGCEGGGCGGQAKAGACAMSHAATTTDPAKQPACGPGAGGCPEKEAGRDCTDCSNHPNCATTKAGACPAKAAGNECTDCTEHKGCPMSTTSTPAKSPEPAAKPTPK
jgi:hypothetical protein